MTEKSSTNNSMTIIIAAAGQFGRAAAGLLNDSAYELLAFADNSEKLQGTIYAHPLGKDLPIVSMEQAVRMNPDAMLIGVIDEERSGQLENQILAGLEFFVPRLTEGGMILLHDYLNERFRGARKAVEDYEAKYGRLRLVPLCDLHGSAVILK